MHNLTICLLKHLSRLRTSQQKTEPDFAEVFRDTKSFRNTETDLLDHRELIVCGCIMAAWINTWEMRSWHSCLSLRSGHLVHSSLAFLFSRLVCIRPEDHNVYFETVTFRKDAFNFRIFRLWSFFMIEACLTCTHRCLTMLSKTKRFFSKTTVEDLVCPCTWGYMMFCFVILICANLHFRWTPPHTLSCSTGA